MELKKCLLTKNDCYKKGQNITPKGIVVHSTGANNPTLKRYLAPDDGLIGVNKYNNHWNRSGISTCVHAFIGKDIKGNVQVYQTLPFNFACWGVGKGKKGSYNYNPAYIQFEICEDNLKDKDYFTKAFNLAIEFCAYLCKKYNLSVDNVVSHQEAYKKGYGSNHEDCNHWLKEFGKDMNWFRSEVKAKLTGASKPQSTSSEVKGKKVNYLVQINTAELNVREKPDADAKINTIVKRGEVYTIVEEYKGWGKLKSGAGWISLNLTKPYKKTSKPKKSVTEVAKDVIAGKYGNGETRVKNLEKEGYNAKEVQAEVNRLLK
jgi:N-acetylmuramoyl-L-alanine amidase